jgi:hypothetical protein
VNLWVTQSTLSRKGEGQQSILGKRRTRKVTQNVALQDPRDMAKARLLEIQSSWSNEETHRYGD